MKRIAINILLIVVCLLLSVVIIMPFAGNAYFKIGETLERNYRWKISDKMFDMAVRLDPLSAKYHMGMGIFYMKRAAVLRDKTPALLKAEDEFKKTFELNPYNVRCLLGLASAEAELFLADAVEYDDRLGNSIKHFKEAFEKHPNNYEINYDIGLDLLRLWDYLDGDSRRFALERFRHCMEDAPWYWERVYPRIWGKVKDFGALLEATPENLKAYENLYNFLKENNLFKYRKEAITLINQYREIEKPQLLREERLNESKRLNEIKELFKKDRGYIEITEKVSRKQWQYKTRDGKYIITDGRMYGNSTIYAPINMKAGEAAISLKARKELVIKTENPQNPKFYPYMIIKLDSEEIGETFVGNDDWRDYVFSVKSNGGLKVLSVSFINDIYQPQKGEDRNLFIGDVSILY